MNRIEAIIDGVIEREGDLEAMPRRRASRQL